MLENINNSEQMMILMVHCSLLEWLKIYLKAKENNIPRYWKTWLNYISRNRGMIWWGGYGKSTEQTAYENILSELNLLYLEVYKNGKPLAEQIGGQIFVDTWGLVFPNEPDKVLTSHH